MECYHCFHSESNNDLIRPSKSHLKGDLIISNVSLKLISLNSLPCGVPEKSLIFGVLFREGRGGSYFPSYEIVLDELRDYRFYAEDMVHPSAQAVQYVWERFVSTYMSPQTLQQMQTLHRFYQKKHHRILHPDSEESKRFLQQLAEEEKRLKTLFNL